ncbi:MAG: hypothetical protein MZV63_14485 [Marinilabiliales bacterium]|nr:hypothetical protein [Marinilabiliales bacterium]
MLLNPYIAERPLRSYQLHVEELAEKPGFFQISAEFRPHVAITGMDVNLKLIALPFYGRRLEYNCSNNP